MYLYIYYSLVTINCGIDLNLLKRIFAFFLNWRNSVIKSLYRPKDNQHYT